MSQAHHPIFDPEKRNPTDSDFAREEVVLANRNAGTLLEALRHDVTPPGLHYLLVHFDVPYVPSGAGWTLDIGGLVERPLRLTLDELKRCPERTLRVTLECAGNGRATIVPRWPSQPWHYEAVGTADWTGTPLRHLLERAGLAAGVRDVVFFGRDRGFDGGVEHNYGRSLSPAQALGEDVLVAWAMNGAPLLPQHGFPLRLIVPGWYGMTSVKWLARIEAVAQPFTGHQQAKSYRIKLDENDPGEPLTRMHPRALMVPPGIPDYPTRHRTVPAGSCMLSGRAWSGWGPIERVDVSTDGGGTWDQAELEDDVGSPWAWRAWRYRWEATPGERELCCRAHDAAGNAQPLGPAWNLGGYANNAVQRVPATVA
jgi:DMSO/TMAO reductase YedYZ molybdopterin-dependent catalytic subunit